MFNLAVDFNSPIFQMAIIPKNAKVDPYANVTRINSAKNTTWRKTTKTICGQKCLKYGEGEDVEYSIFGEKGEMFEFDSDRMVAIITNHFLANRLKLGPNGYKLKEGEEAKVMFPKSELQKYLKLLKVPKTYPKQRRLANKRK